MDSVVVAAMITAGTKIGQSLLEKWTGKNAEKNTVDHVSAYYDTLHGLMSDNCMRVLKRLEDGQNRSVVELMKVIYPSFEELHHEEQRRLQSEFDYRLFFMSLSGLIIRPTREFYITATGAEFIRQAREKHQYMTVLFG
jgi:hypothetical protein